MSAFTSCHININGSTKNTIENNNSDKYVELQRARTFISWYKHMIDNDRSNLSLYFSEEIILEWFGRTIKTRTKVTAFLKFDMQCTHHDFTSVENIERVIMRNEKSQRKDLDSSSPLQSPEMIEIKRPGKRKLLESRCHSPEWAEGCQPPDEETKNPKVPKIMCPEPPMNRRKRLFSEDDSEMNSKGDGMLGRRSKRKCVEPTITPPNKEVGQGDCMPSTSGNTQPTHDNSNSEPVKLAVECNGFIEFTRSKNTHGSDTMKWERKCKVQISYSEDPLNIGEYIIWYLRYTDETKCRRNLLAAFEEVAQEESKDTQMIPKHSQE